MSVLLNVQHAAANSFSLGSDYEMQVAISESLYRLTSKKMREELAGKWFNYRSFASTFTTIVVKDFETVCSCSRKALFWNGILVNMTRMLYYLHECGIFFFIFFMKDCRMFLNELNGCFGSSRRYLHIPSTICDSTHAWVYRCVFSSC